MLKVQLFARYIVIIINITIITWLGKQQMENWYICNISNSICNSFCSVCDLFELNKKLYEPNSPVAVYVLLV